MGPLETYLKPFRVLFKYLLLFVFSGITHGAELTPWDSDQCQRVLADGTSLSATQLAKVGLVRRQIHDSSESDLVLRVFVTTRGPQTKTVILLGENHWARPIDHENGKLLVDGFPVVGIEGFNETKNPILGSATLPTRKVLTYSTATFVLVIALKAFLYEMVTQPEDGLYKRFVKTLCQVR